MQNPDDAVDDQHQVGVGHSICNLHVHHVIEDLEEYSSMVGSHVLALLFIISQIKP